MLTVDSAKALVVELTQVQSLDFNDVDPELLVEILKMADEHFFNEDDQTATGLAITDEQYDMIKQFAKMFDPTNVYFTGVGSMVRGGKVDLPVKMGSLTQVYQGDYSKWLDQHQVPDYELVVTSDKLDGASNLLVYNGGKLQIAYSRGDGYQGADITRHCVNIDDVPQAINSTAPLIVRAETIVSKANFARIQALPAGTFRREYKNARNMVSGVMNSSTPNNLVYQYINVVAYEIVGSKLAKQDQLELLKQLGFNVVNYTIHKAHALDDEKLTKILSDAKAQSKYELDGIVI